MRIPIKKSHEDSNELLSIIEANKGYSEGPEAEAWLTQFIGKDTILVRACLSTPKGIDKPYLK